MTVAKTSSGRTPGDILRALDTLREQDAPTHGGRVLSYVYDWDGPNSMNSPQPPSRACNP